MSTVGWNILLLGLSLTVAAVAQKGKPYLQRLIEDGFKSADINVVYFITANDVESELFRGNYPRFVMLTMEEQSKKFKSKNHFIQIIAQSLVVLDARKEPMKDRRCLFFILKELSRIWNPLSNKFVLLVSSAFYDRATLNNLQDGLTKLGVGYSLVLYYDQANPSNDAVRMTRISFGHQTTISTTGFADYRHLLRLDLRTLDGIRVAGVLYQFFPFSYTGRSGHWDGTDFYMWNVMAKQLRLRLQLIHAKPGTIYIGGAYSPAMRNRSVDFVATRDVFVNDGMQKIMLASRDYFSLVVPKPVTLNLMDALLQPFTKEVWIMVGVLVSIRILFAHLHDALMLLDMAGTIRNRTSYILDNDYPWFGWMKLASSILTFLLVEAYLAQVTSLLLTLRYIEGPQTVDQFIASNILIVEPLQQTHFLMQVNQAQKALLKKRFVKRTPEELANMSDAYVEYRSRVRFMNYGTEPIDPITGKRNYYILREPLAEVRFQYSFAKPTAFMRVAEHCFLWYEENGLRLHIDDAYDRWAKKLHSSKQHGISGSVLVFSDLSSLWICTIVGWCVSGLVFLIELLIHSRNRNRRFKNTFL
ncbi:uncharacterized protein LOC126568050 [Anopheles maculipalpis]|uniref:uncharacterized protein LOC126568050 n=1 Tax=Anopheles maculipalpis TaxID=1496333 RepID=UPI00215954D5|nr:uncharacterized protein LOC126568050 [Anopheles maculipalpis]